MEGDNDLHIGNDPEPSFAISTKSEEGRRLEDHLRRSVRLEKGVSQP